MGGKTFYNALGVERDADTDRIRRAYRERVKDHHPDVSDDPDSRRRFERLTTARDVLADDAERRRYERLGHATYVDTHVSGDAWTNEGPNRSRSDGTVTADRSGNTSGQGRWPWVAPEPKGRPSRGGRPDQGGAWQQASATYRSRPTGGSAPRGPPLRDLQRALRLLGPWLVVYAIFLGSGAAVVGGFVAEYAADPTLSIPLAAGGVGVLALVVFLTAVHVATRLAV